ncbi:hypothetical protein IWW40_003522 [Coemansia sp. RSA 1250]|nr:hypothetical protein IWW40_003522 [Coemansia sp. RSA 1250]
MPSTAPPPPMANELLPGQLVQKDHRRDWEEYWAAGGTEHDQQGPAEALRELLEDHRWLLPRGRCLVAGCGRGHDALYLAKRGHNCLGIDFCDAAIANAQKHTNTVPQGTLIVLLYPLIRRGQSPPYRVTMAECETHLKRYFVLVRVDPNCRCIEGQEGNELLSVWKRL